MLLCIIAADLRGALRAGGILLFVKVVNTEALWCFTQSPAIELLGNRCG